MEKFKKTLKFIVDLLSNILIICLSIILIFLLFTRFVIKDSSYLYKDTYFYKVISGSMEPTLNIGDYILVQKQDKYKVGDIITYKDGNTYITHRITKINKKEITAQGDANNTEDETIITKNQIKGKYIKKINKFGKVYETITNKHTIIITVLFLIIIKFGIKLLTER